MFCHSYPTWLNKERQAECSLSGNAGHLIRENKVANASLRRSGASVEGMVNICEPLVNVVTKNKPKRLVGLGQNDMRPDIEV